MNRAELPLALAAALLLVGGAWRVAEAGGLDTLAATLLAAGLITLGVWLRGGDE